MVHFFLLNNTDVCLKHMSPPPPWVTWALEHKYTHIYPYTYKHTGTCQHCCTAALRYSRPESKQNMWWFSRWGIFAVGMARCRRRGECRGSLPSLSPSLCPQLFALAGDGCGMQWLVDSYSPSQLGQGRLVALTAQPRWAEPPQGHLEVPSTCL